MLVGMKEAGEITHAHKGGNSGRGDQTTKLADLEISRDLSSRAQRIASVPEDKFEAVIAEAKEGERELTRRLVNRGPVHWSS